MLSGRIMCLDLGDARIGVAMSDMLGITAQGKEVIQSKSDDVNLAKFKTLISENNVTKLVVGYPLNMDGTEGEKAKAIRVQFEFIKENVNIEAILWDERMSTVMAHRALDEGNVHWKKKKNVVDMLAAQVILQSYLDSQN